MIKSETMVLVIFHFHFSNEPKTILCIIRIIHQNNPNFAIIKLTYSIWFKVQTYREEVEGHYGQTERCFTFLYSFGQVVSTVKGVVPEHSQTLIDYGDKKPRKSSIHNRVLDP